MERASKNLLFATTIVLFYPLEMVRQSFLDEEYGQENGVQSCNVWGYLCALKDVFEKNLGFFQFILAPVAVVFPSRTIVDYFSDCSAQIQWNDAEMFKVDAPLSFSSNPKEMLLLFPTISKAPSNDAENSPNKVRWDSTQKRKEEKCVAFHLSQPLNRHWLSSIPFLKRELALHT